MSTDARIPANQSNFPNSIVLIAPTYSYRAHVFLSAAEKHGISTIFVSDGESDISPTIRSGFRVDFSDAEYIADSIASKLSDKNVCAIIAPDEKFVEIAATVAKILNVPHNSPESLRTSTNKFQARKVLSQSNVLVPDFWTVDLNKEIEIQVNDVEYPCVAKPTSLSASKGVIRADDQPQLIDAIERIRSILSREQVGEIQQKILIEKYIPGSEHSLEGYLTENRLETICIFDKPDPLEGPYFEETCFVTPSVLDEDVQQRICDTVFEACRAFGLRMGPIHAEVRINNSKVWILEVAARSIGGDCARLFELATDTSLEEFIVCKSAGQSIDTLKFSNSTGVAMIPVTAGGILRRIEGVVDAQSVDGILDVRIDVRSGEKITPWPEGSRYPGFIYAEARNPERVKQSLREALSNIKFVCMPEFPITLSELELEAKI